MKTIKLVFIFQVLMMLSGLGLISLLVLHFGAGVDLPAIVWVAPCLGETIAVLGALFTMWRMFDD